MSNIFCNDTCDENEFATDETPLLASSSEGRPLSGTDINILHPSSLSDIDIENVTTHKNTIIGMICVGVGTAFIGTFIN